MLAALATLRQCIENCSEAEWNQSHNDAPFSQVLFHTLFYTDLYLSDGRNEFKLQGFHKENMDIFREYEELEYRKAEELYTRGEIEKYFNFCHGKINSYFDIFNAGNLCEKSPHLDFTYLELFIDVIRHIQHHAAQLGLRMQQITGKELNWIASGWKI